MFAIPVRETTGLKGQQPSNFVQSNGFWMLDIAARRLRHHGETGPPTRATGITRFQLDTVPTCCLWEPRPAAWRNSR
jgi:hypothetical protein